MTYEIAGNRCEICGQEAKVAMNGTVNDNNGLELHYACENTQHIHELWDKLGKP